jgi:hypothetical protein
MIGSTDTVVIESVTKEVKANLQGYVYDPMYVHTDHNFTTQLLHKVAELDVKLKALEARLAATDVSIVKLTPTRPPKATAAPTEGPTLAPVVKVTLPPRAKSKAPKVKSWFNQLPSGYNVTF